nr:PREDICTED: uncharacterized protein LOC105676346 isoform X1 [Linepithema humile]
MLNMLARHTQVVYLLVLSYVTLQEAFQIKQIPGTLELCQRKTDTQVSRTFNLLTSLLWNTFDTFDDEWIRKPEQDSKLAITFYHKLNLSPFLTYILKDKAWNIEVRKGIWMKLILSAVQINEHTGARNINAFKIHWQYRSSKRKTNDWDESCILTFDDNYGGIHPKNASLSRDDFIRQWHKIMTTLNHINTQSSKIDKHALNTLLNKYSSKIIKRKTEDDVVNMHSSLDLQDPSKIGFSWEDYIKTQIKLVRNLLSSNYGNLTSLVNNYTSSTFRRDKSIVTVFYNTISFIDKFMKKNVFLFKYGLEYFLEILDLKLTLLETLFEQDEDQVEPRFQQK